jgi:hypothetical protein
MKRLTAIGTILAMGLAAPAASASTGDIIAPQHPPLYTANDGWQAGTCKIDIPTCSVDTPGQFFETAAAHPPVGFTQFIVKHTPEEGLLQKPVGELKDVRVDLPIGLSVNPGATPRCDLSAFEAAAVNCVAAGAKVGTSFVTAADPVLGIVAPPLTADVYNITPQEGEPALFGLELLGNEIFLKSDVESGGDFHEGFSIAVPKALELPGLEGFILKNRLVFDGTSGDGTFITTPSTCLGPAGTGPGQSGSIYSTWLLAASYAEETGGYRFPANAAPAFESPIPPGTSPKDCAAIPYAPGIGVDPGTTQTDSPSGATVAVTVPHIKGAASQDSSVTRATAVALPVGMGLNPSAADGLKTCEDSQFPLKGRAPTSCPSQSKVGSVEIQSPPLPEGNLSGDVFVGKQLSRDPESGEEYRIFIDAKSTRYGVEVRLLGRVRANAATGQLTTTISETPQVPFTSFKLSFTGGPKAVLSSPPVCASTAAATMAPWSGNAAAKPTAPIVLTAAPGGKPCAKTLAERPFAPGFSAKPKGTKAGAYSPLTMHVAGGDGQQELKGVDVTLAPGMTGKLAGIPYCSGRPGPGGGPPPGPAAPSRPAPAARRRVSSAAPRSPPAPAPRRCTSAARSSSQAPTTGLLSPWQSSPPPRPGPSTWARSWCGWRCSSNRRRPRSAPSPTRSPTSTVAPSSASAPSTSTSTARTSPSTRPAAGR